MKKIMTTLLMALSASVFAQKIDASKVPAPVKSTFTKNFSEVKDVKWEQEKGNYEANFNQNGQKMSALMDATGNLLETETAIGVHALPSGVTDYIAKNYKDEKIKEAARLKMANGDINYEAEVKGTDLIFDATGRFIKAVKD